MSGIAMMTAFYMFRLYYVIFWGKSYYEANIDNGAHKPHEAPLTMTFPLIFLSIITLLCGFIPFGQYVSANGIGFTTHIHWNVALTSVGLAVVAIIAATIMYKGEETPFADKLAKHSQHFIRQHIVVSTWTKYGSLLLIRLSSAL